MSKLSFIIPAFNAENTLKRCLKSITDQSYTDLEIIIVDDGSFDDTYALSRILADQDSRIIALHQSNSGVSSARNKGLEYASGDYVFFCDSDDYLEPDSLSEAVTKIDESGADIVTFDHFRDIGLISNRTHIFPESFQTDRRETLDALQYLLLCIQPAKISTYEFLYCNGLGGAAWHHFFKRSVIEEKNLKFDSRLDGLLEDGYFVMNFLENAKTAAYYGIPVYHYSPGAESSTHGYRPDFDQRCCRAYEHFLAFGKEHNKDEQFYQGLYARLAYFVKGLLDVDFFCLENPFPESDRYFAFVQTISNEPFSSGLERLDISQFLSKKERMQTRLLKSKQKKLYWELRKAKQRVKGLAKKVRSYH